MSNQTVSEPTQEQLNRRAIVYAGIISGWLANSRHSSSYASSAAKEFNAIAEEVMGKNWREGLFQHSRQHQSRFLRPDGAEARQCAVARRVQALTNGVQTSMHQVWTVDATAGILERFQGITL
jgi:hypothetical protein